MAPTGDERLAFVKFEFGSFYELTTQGTLIIATDGLTAWHAFEAPIHGLVLSTSYDPHAPVLLGAGQPLMYSVKSKQFEKRTLKKTATCVGTPLAGDQGLLLHSEMAKGGRVAFRELFTINGRDVEIAGTQGDSLTVSLITATKAGLCLQRQWELYCGGRGAEFFTPTWSVGNPMGLKVEAACHYGRTSPDEDPIIEDKELTFSFDATTLKALNENE